ELLARYWTPAEKNTLLAPLDGLLLANRLAWVALAAAILAVAFARFRFAHPAEAGADRRGGKGRRAAKSDDVDAASGEALTPGALPQVAPSYGLRAQLIQFLSVARRSFWGIVRNRYFFAIAGGGVVFMLLMSTLLQEMYGTTIWPVTYAVLEILGPNFW